MSRANTVRVRFTGGPLRGRSVEISEATAKRGILYLVHQSHWKGPESRYLVKFSETHGWLADRL